MSKNIISLSTDEHKALDTILTKVAKDNQIDNVSKVSITLTENAGMIKFDITHDEIEEV